MATKLENLQLEIAHFENFVKHIPGSNEWDEDTLNDFLSLGLLQVSTAFEQAVAACGGNTVISEDHADISNGIDCKMVTARTHRTGQSYDAPVCEIYGKTGGLAVQVYERKQNRFFYFAIPRAAYEHIPKSSNIEIPFELNGNPRRNPKGRVKVNWWIYEVKTFEKMCQFNG